MTISRRKFLVAATATGVSCGLAALIANGDAKPTYVWRGSALGGEARIALYGTDQAVARDALEAAAREIERLEGIFSLHRSESEVSRFNALGALDNPSHDLIEVLRASEAWRTKTSGAFNPLVQPMWQAAAAGTEITNDLIEAAKGAVQIGDRIALPPGTRVTLNGIAQGRIADRVTDILVGRGFDNVVIDAGELRLPGKERRAIGVPALKSAISVSEVAIATSEPKSLIFDAKAFRHHLIDPRTGASPRYWESISVLAPTAETADALSTAFAILPADAVADLAGSIDGVAVIGSDLHGRVRTFGSRKLIG